MTVLSDLPAYHDHTPAFTSQLGAPLGASVPLRLHTTLPVTGVRLKLVEHGEIVERPATPIPGRPGWFEATLPVIAARVRYAWMLVLPDDHLNLTAAGLHHTRRAYRDWFQYLAGYVAPEWAWKSVFYQIFPDRYRNGDPDSDVRDGEYLYGGKPVTHPAWDAPVTRAGDIHAHYGGDLDGIMESLPYLTDLGVNALWLTPIFQSPSNHRYDTTDYRTVDPHLGGQAAFDALMAESAQRDVRVVLDGVFNHTGNEHALFQKALADAGSPERAMFTWRDGQQPPYAAFSDVPTLPKIDYGSEAAAQEFLDGEESVVRHWLRQGVAGWRLDVAHMIGRGGTDEGNLELHRRLKRAARQVNPQAYVFGERFFDAEEALRGDGEDGAMNYHGFGLPVMQWLSGATQSGVPSRLDGVELADLLWDAYHVLPPQVALNQFNLLDSHDTPRALYRLGGDTTKLRAALTLLLGYAGVPCLFYGTEVGLTQTERGAMPFCRVPMPWDEARWDHDLLAWTRAMIAVRREALVLQQGSLRFLLAEPDAVGFLRAYGGADGRVACAAVLTSRRSDPHEVEVILPEGTWRDALSGEALDGGAQVLNLTGGRLLLQE